MKNITDAGFLALKEGIETYKRPYGYYIIKLVDISELRSSGAAQEEIADIVFQHFDNKDWPPPEQRPTDQTWQDYTFDREVAFETAVEVLMGGPSVGYIHEFIPREQAEVFVAQFEVLFDQDKIYYMGISLGDPNYVFQHGLAIISRTRAGCVWVVESD